MYLVSAKQMQDIDRETIDGIGIPGLVLMEHAGTLTARAIVDRYGTGKRITVLCGKGNNGGDGFVIARLLRSAGAEVTVLLAGEPEKVAGDARINLEAYRRAGGTLFAGEMANATRLSGALRHADLIVDALFGTGLNQPLRKPVSSWVAALARHDKPVVAVDIPSGINADSGEVMGVAVQADLTVTYACPKRGHLSGDGIRHTGTLVVADIGIPDTVAEAAGIRVHLTRSTDAAGWLPPRPAGGHKGSFGHLLVAGGSPGMTGAPCLAARGAQRVGTGLVTVAAPEGLNDIIEIKLTEAMSLPLPQTGERTFGESALTPLLAAASERSALILGPGISRHPDTAQFVRDVVERYDGPLVIDADALNALSGHMKHFPRRVAPTVLTPHPGEMARLAGISTTLLQSDRIEAAQAMAAEHEAVVVLKGQFTVVADPFGGTYVNPTGGPVLASGGTGDVLAGMIGGFLAQGLGAGPAAALAAYLHGLAADRWSAKHGDRGLTAGALARGIPDAMNALTQGAVTDTITHLSPLESGPNPGQ